MDLTQLTDDQLAEEFSKASANGESLSPFIEEMKNRMSPTTKSHDVVIEDPGAVGLCVSCE